MYKSTHKKDKYYNENSPINPDDTKIAILGRSSNSLIDAPIDDDTWRKWSLNDNTQRFDVSKFEKWFDLHSYVYNHNFKKTNHGSFLNSIQPKLILMDDDVLGLLKKHDNYPEAEKFGLSAIVAHFNSLYFTCSIAYMIAYALYTENPSNLTIGLFGIDLANREEYREQRQCVLYWVGRAIQAGANVVISKNSALFGYTRMYGLDKNPVEVKDEFCTITI